MNKQLIASTALAGLLSSAALPAFASVAAPSNRHEMVATQISSAPLLPNYQPATDQELGQVEGEGLLSALVGGLAGATIGAVAYSSSKFYEGVADHNWSWQWDHFNECVFVGGVTGLVGGAFTFTP